MKKLIANTQKSKGRAVPPKTSTWTQIAGFILLIAGLISLAIVAAYILLKEANHNLPQTMAILFFLVMMGMALAFPELLTDENKGLSTMRIAVFMIVNIFCMLVIKIGWDSDITSFAQIGINQYWVAILAFVFGSKAAQSFFESKMAQLNPPNTSAIDIVEENIIPKENILIEAIELESDDWERLYGPMESIEIGQKRVNGVITDISCIVFKPLNKLKISPNHYQSIPPQINYIASDGIEYNIPTDVQQTKGKIIPNSLHTCVGVKPKLPGCSISRADSDVTGSIGLKVFKGNSAYIVSCFHVLCSNELSNGDITYSNSNSNNLIICPSKQDNGTTNDTIAIVIEGSLDQYGDSAIALLKNSTDVFSSISVNGIYKEVSEIIIVDSSHTKDEYPVYMTGRTSGCIIGNLKSSYARCRVQYTIKGKPCEILLKGMLCISKIAEEGDSGSFVVDRNGKAIGMIVATTPMDTYVMPVNRILSKHNIKLT